MQDIVISQVNDWKQQLKKGTLELAVLALLKAKRSYGLELLERLKEMEIEVSDGSIYPLLSRLRVEKRSQRNGLTKTWATLTSFTPSHRMATASYVACSPRGVTTQPLSIA